MGFSKAYIALLAGVALACSSATDAADRQLTIATDRLVYHIDSSDVVQSRLVNRGPEPIYAALPGGFVSVQKQQGLAWVDLGPFWYGTYLVVPYVRVVGAGDSLTGPSLPTLNSHLRGPGRFRLVYIVYGDSTVRRLLPLEARVSNVFQIDY